MCHPLPPDITLSYGYIKLSRRCRLRPGLLVWVTRKGDPGTRTGCGPFICENVQKGGQQPRCANEQVAVGLPGTAQNAPRDCPVEGQSGATTTSFVSEAPSWGCSVPCTSSPLANSSRPESTLRQRNTGSRWQPASGGLVGDRHR